MFEAASTDGLEEQARQREAERSFDRAVFAAQEQFGQFLSSATSGRDFDDRLALCRDELRQVIEAHGIMPVHGIVRRVAKTMRPDFSKKATRKQAQFSVGETVFLPDGDSGEVAEYPYTAPDGTVYYTQIKVNHEDGSEWVGPTDEVESADQLYRDDRYSKRTAGVQSPFAQAKRKQAALRTASALGSWSPYSDDTGSGFDAYSTDGYLRAVVIGNNEHGYKSLPDGPGPETEWGVTGGSWTWEVYNVDTDETVASGTASTDTEAKNAAEQAAAGAARTSRRKRANIDWVDQGPGYWTGVVLDADSAYVEVQEENGRFLWWVYSGDDEDATQIGMGSGKSLEDAERQAAETAKNQKGHYYPNAKRKQGATFDENTWQWVDDSGAPLSADEVEELGYDPSGRDQGTRPSPYTPGLTRHPIPSEVYSSRGTTARRKRTAQIQNQYEEWADDFDLDPFDINTLVRFQHEHFLEPGELELLEKAYELEDDKWASRKQAEEKPKDLVPEGDWEGYLDEVSPQSEPAADKNFASKQAIRDDTEWESYEGDDPDGSWAEMDDWLTRTQTDPNQGREQREWERQQLDTYNQNAYDEFRDVPVRANREATHRTADHWKFDTQFQQFLLDTFGTTHGLTDDEIIEAMEAYAGIGPQVTQEPVQEPAAPAPDITNIAAGRKHASDSDREEIIDTMMQLLQSKGIDPNTQTEAINELADVIEQFPGEYDYVLDDADELIGVMKSETDSWRWASKKKQAETYNGWEPSSDPDVWNKYYSDDVVGTIVRHSDDEYGWRIEDDNTYEEIASGSEYDLDAAIRSADAAGRG